MIDEALKTHKETTFGWLLMAQELATAWKARLIRNAAEQAAKAERTAPHRLLTPR